ncbi:MAG: hypothetical protein AB7G39_10085 [Alphaproteobacteria bacterium]
MRIGLDFDNTLVGYDHLFAEEAAAQGLAGAEGGKRALRDRLRALPDGERRWQAVQAAVYGRRMAEARLMPGAGVFLRACKNAGIPVAIVSHKTRHAALDPGGVDLRGAALDWMRRQGFFAEDGFGLDPERVFFEPTRQDKIGRIAAIGCTDFVDDLVEVFAEPSFPVQVRRHLYDPGETPAPPGPYTAYRSWEALADALL